MDWNDCDNLTHTHAQWIGKRKREIKKKRKKEKKKKRKYSENLNFNLFSIISKYKNCP